MRKFWFIFMLFFISGACGLIYQVVWSRMMGLIFGRSILAVGIVLAAFMSGLALGSFLLGRYADKSRNPLRLYAWYEVGIGITALAASVLLMNISPFYVRLHSAFGESSLWLSVTRFGIAFVLLIIPTVLMGATLPILSRVVIRNLQWVGSELGKLYAINTVGAVAGTLAAGFFLIRFFGLYGAIAVAVFGNLAVGLLAWVVAARQGPDEGGIPVDDEPPVTTRISREPPDRATAALLMTVFALSGLTSFAYEIFWTRSLVFVLGNTTYAFTLMLTAFLTGIALGGAAVRYVADRVESPLRLFALIEILIGISSAASVPFLFYLLQSEAIEGLVQSMSNDMGLLVLSESLVALLLMLLPATLIGTTLPLMGRIFVQNLQQTGTSVGKVYAVNTVGNVIGALLPGLLILPLLGVQKGILLMAALNISLGVAIFLARPSKALLAAGAASLVFVISALSLSNATIAFRFPSESQTARDAVLYYEEGPLVTTKVWVGANSGKKMISVDGINIGGTHDADYKQQILAHLPKLLLRDYRSELSIGLGSGILIGESARHEKLERIVCAEIAPSVVRGAGYFREENYGILSQTETEIVVDDIGHYLQTTDESFDIISADGKTAEKYSTNAFSYSLDYYAFLRQRLAPGGLVIQWIPTALPSSQYHLVLRTFLESFPHVTHWYFPPVGRFFLSNTFLIGSNEPIDLDPGQIQRAMDADPVAFHGIRKYGLKNAEEILSHFVAAEGTLRRAVRKGPLNSFARPYYEFYSPADYAVSSRERTLENHRFFQSIRGPDFENLVLFGLDDSWKALLRRHYDAEGYFLHGLAAQMAGEKYTSVLHHFDRAVGFAPESSVLRNQVVSYLMDRFRYHYANRLFDNAAAFLRLATEIHPESPDVHEDYGMMLLLLGQEEQAAVQLKQAVEMAPDLVFARRALGELYAAQGESDKALEQWRRALSVDPENVRTLTSIGVHLARNGAIADAKSYLRKAYDLARQNPEVIHGYATVLYLANDFRDAEKIVREGGNYYEEDPEFRRLREQILQR